MVAEPYLIESGDSRGRQYQLTVRSFGTSEVRAAAEGAACAQLQNADAFWPSTIGYLTNKL
jgi:hypothetical protein